MRRCFSFEVADLGPSIGVTELADQAYTAVNNQSLLSVNNGLMAVRSQDLYIDDVLPPSTNLGLILLITLYNGILATISSALILSGGRRKDRMVEWY